MFFQSDSIDRVGPDCYVVHGTLEIRGVRRPLAIPMTQTVLRAPDSGWGNVRVGGSGRVTIKRTDSGILGGEFWGQKALADEIELLGQVRGETVPCPRPSTPDRGSRNRIASTALLLLLIPPVDYWSAPEQGFCGGPETPPEATKSFQVHDAASPAGPCPHHAVFVAGGRPATGAAKGKHQSQARRPHPAGGPAPPHANSQKTLLKDGPPPADEPTAHRSGSKSPGASA
jgi:hypothetical protein